MPQHLSFKTLPNFSVSFSNSTPTPNNVLELLQSCKLGHSKSCCLEYAQQCTFFVFEIVAWSWLQERHKIVYFDPIFWWISIIDGLFEFLLEFIRTKVLNEHERTHFYKLGEWHSWKDSFNMLLGKEEDSIPSLCIFWYFTQHIGSFSQLSWSELMLSYCQCLADMRVKHWTSLIQMSVGKENLSNKWIIDLDSIFQDNFFYFFH